MSSLAELVLVGFNLSNTEIPWSILEVKKLRFLGLSNNNLRGKLFPQMKTEMLYVNGNNIISEREEGSLRSSMMRVWEEGLVFGETMICVSLEMKSRTLVSTSTTNEKTTSEIKIVQTYVF
ncbi:unnamed protein product [Brassica rapa subsp. narinosa]